MLCTICKKPIVLIPPASERAAKCGGTPEDYIRLFTTHSNCLIQKRNEDVSKLIKEKYHDTHRK